MPAEAAEGRRVRTPSRAMGSRGVVSAGHPLAADAALAVLADGGNAVDAVLAGAAVQCVVEFPWCGIGGDAFLLVSEPSAGIVALNGSGGAPSGIDSLIPGHRLPRYGPLTPTVPGFVAAWCAAAERFGSRPRGKLLAPAIELAEGFPVSPRLAAAIGRVRPHHGAHPELGALLDRNGGDGTFRWPELAATLEAIADGGREAFYGGPVGARLATHVQARGGVLGREDLAAHAAEWVEPISTTYRGRAVVEHPPVSLGVLLLQELRIFEGFDASGLQLGSAELLDVMVRCKRAAFLDGLAVIGDPDHFPAPVDELLAADRAAWWRQQLTEMVPGQAPEPAGQVPTDTTCIATADAGGGTAVLIHSLFNEFGSRELADGTGVLLNDRLADLPVAGDGPRSARGLMRPPHTLNTWMLVDDGSVVLAGATPGGRGQVQTSFQLLTAILDHGQSAVDAAGAARWLDGAPRVPDDADLLLLERGFPPSVADELATRSGYRVRVVGGDQDDLFGACTLVGRDPTTGALSAVADHRRAVSARGC